MRIIFQPKSAKKVHTLPHVIPGYKSPVMYRGNAAGRGSQLIPINN